MYKLIKRTDDRTQVTVLGGILKINEDGSDISIPLDPANTDYQEYLKWVDAGNTADE